MLGDGETNDVSLDAFSVSSNVDLPIENDEKYALEFMLFNRHSFFLPINVFLKKRAAIVSKMAYDYVFLFDFSNHPHEKNRIINAFFKGLSR
jgi:hypothetical protein